MSANICKECTHYLLPKSSNQHPRCTRTKVKQIDLVTGEPLWQLNIPECNEERYGKGQCGIEGRFWVKADSVDGL